jgi:hypothetical protein
MPVGYQEAVENRSEKNDQSIIDSLVKEIDSKLMNADWLEEWRCGDRESPFWMFKHGEPVSDHVRETIVSLYEKAGWGSVTVRNNYEGTPSEHHSVIVLRKDAVAYPGH